MSESVRKKILFVCTGNSCRSIMAEAYFKKRIRENNLPFEVRSAGTIALNGGKPSEETIEVLKKEGIDATGYESTKLEEEVIDWADVILVMEPEHREAVISLCPLAAGKIFMLGEFNPEAKDILIPDPIGRSYSFYKVTFSLIKRAIDGLVGDTGTRRS